MNWDQIEGGWTELKGRARTRWGEITDDEWSQTEGRREQIVGAIQRKYGQAREAVEREVDDWASGL